MNLFVDTRVSRCVKCDGLTYPRKFPLFIHVEGWGPFILGKTCKYCPRCEIIVCHQDELENELTNTFQRLKPEVIGADYLVLGTVERKTWKAGVEGNPASVHETLEHTADFKKSSDLWYDPGGWRPKDAPPQFLEPRPPDTPCRQARLKRDPSAAGDPSPGLLQRSQRPGKSENPWDEKPHTP